MPHVTVDVGRIAIKAHMFIVKRLRSDLILGRLWARSARAQFTNEDDGQYTIRIKSPDKRCQVKFCIVPAVHE